MFICLFLRFVFDDVNVRNVNCFLVCIVIVFLLKINIIKIGLNVLEYMKCILLNRFKLNFCLFKI